MIGNLGDGSRKVQRSRILQLLIEARGHEVPLPEIAACAAQYNARIFELRRLGFVILNRTEKRDRIRQSWFRLVSGPPAAESTPKSETPIATSCPTNSIPRESEATLSLFPEGDR